MTSLLGYLAIVLGKAAQSGEQANGSALVADGAKIGPDAGGASSMPDILDIKPLIDMGTDHALISQYIWPAILALIILAALLTGLWLWKRRRPGDGKRRFLPPPPEADQAALAALEALGRELPLPARKFYFRLCAIQRSYMEAHYGFLALEMTREELLLRLDELKLSRELKQTVACFWNMSDSVKFAAAAATDESMQADFQMVAAFIRKTASKEKEQIEVET